jgi:hypothetical protein
MRSFRLLGGCQTLFSGTRRCWTSGESRLAAGSWMTWSWRLRKSTVSRRCDSFLSLCFAVAYRFLDSSPITSPLAATPHCKSSPRTASALPSLSNSSTVCPRPLSLLRDSYSLSLASPGLHGIYFDQALARAKELDDHLERTGKTVGPLRQFFSFSFFKSTKLTTWHYTDGIPISLKDQFDLEGEELNMGPFCLFLPVHLLLPTLSRSSRQFLLPLPPHIVSSPSSESIAEPLYLAGYASYIGRISKRNSSLVQMLLDLGAVLFVRTSCPQTMMVRP